jgi:D-alanyl-D-alanine carboxypeptidase/D-alanyl-D-alanine-endopeptidase (penicillin-binding protein 4)
MKGTAAYGRLRGKTGSIDGVAALAGVVQSRGGELLAFAVVMNDRSKAPGAMRPWQNYFGQALADFNRQTPLTEKPLAIPDTIEPADPQADSEDSP